MRLLVLGGTHFVGRAVVEAALARGDDVTTLNRGVSGTTPDGVTARHADRRDPAALARALEDTTWDAVIDTWSAEPVVVQHSARVLADRVGHYGYVSSRSVYQWPFPAGADESAPVVDADPGSTQHDDYSAAKRGGELAVLESFEGRTLLARAGLILGPHEDVGRLPWWLERMSRGGVVPAPGPADRPLQYVDARDLAEWMVDAASQGVTGAYNAVSRPGHAAIGELLAACNDAVGGNAELVWLPPDAVEECGVTGWVDLPIWVPPQGELAGLHDGDVSAAHDAGLTCRPVHDTVADTWRWLQESGDVTTRTDRPAVGLSPEVEQALLHEAQRRRAAR